MKSHLAIQQALDGFEGNYKQFRFTMKLTKEEWIDVEVENTLNKDRYSQIIDHQYMSSTKESLTFFEEPIDLYDYLIHHLDSVTISNDGLIEFQYSMGIMRKKVKKFSFLLKKQEIEPQQELQKTIQKMNAELLRLRSQADQAKKIKIQNQELKLKLKSQRQKLAETVKEIDLFKSQMPPFVNSLCHHQANSHSKFYKLLCSWNIAKLIRQVPQPKQNLHDANFVNNAQILPHQKANYKFKCNSKNKYLGFCTSSGLGRQQNYNSQQSAYFNYDYFYEGGKYKRNEAVKKDNDEMECSADLTKGIFYWKTRDSMLAECPIPEKMKGKSIYFSIIIGDIGDFVDIMI